jgi:tRNA threonylcarbamoyladenosine biosynthesis protein TsaE
MTLTVVSTSESNTIKIGKIIGSFISPGDVILLSGDLGSGKTKMTQGIIKGIGSDDFARSPTFVLIAEYEAKFPIYHMDLYRLEGIESLERMQIDEYLYGDGVCIVEWANKANKSFPNKSLTVDFSFLSENQRKIDIGWPSDRLEKIGREITRSMIPVN